jgi:hypothetical protein
MRVSDIISQPGDGWPPPEDRSVGWKVDPANGKRNRLWDGSEWTNETKDPVEVMAIRAAEKRAVKDADRPKVVVKNNGCGSGCAGWFGFILVIGLIVVILEALGIKI